jgi:transcriptional regulator with XRE-family HTH domain
MSGRPKRTNAIDAHIGGRIRVRRVACGLTRAELASRLGLTTKQFQKYESGEARVGATHLFEIADCLDIPVAYFFRGLLPGMTPEPRPG